MLWVLRDSLPTPAPAQNGLNNKEINCFIEQNTPRKESRIDLGGGLVRKIVLATSIKRKAQAFYLALHSNITPGRTPQTVWVARIEPGRLCAK